MKVVGLITEYNPFHNGHLYHINKAKEVTDADYVVVVMSGDFVQRGTPAMIQKHARAKMALLCGADLVLELPVNYATASAEKFAYGGVSILNGLGVVDSICFGSECGDTDVLMDIARILVSEPEWYLTALKEHLKYGMSYPAARAAALPQYASILSEPNNILGIEYCKALIKLDSRINPVTIKRQGAGYHDTDINTGSVSNQTFASASAIRVRLKKNDLFHPSKPGALEFDKSSLVDSYCNKCSIHPSDITTITNHIPSLVLPILEKELLENGFISEDDFSQILLYKLLMLKSPAELSGYMDMSDELANRIYKQRYQFKSFSQYADLLKTKEVTRTRINRALLHFILELKDDMPDAAYGRILGFRKSSSQLLSKIKEYGMISLISKTSTADSSLSEKESALLVKSVDASNIYEMIVSQKNCKPLFHEYQKQVIILS